MRYLQFAGPQKQFLGAKVAAGPSNSVVFDRQSMYYVAGKVRFLSIFPVDCTDSAHFSGKTRAMVGTTWAALCFLMLMTRRLGRSTILNFPTYARYHGV